MIRKELPSENPDMENAEEKSYPKGPPPAPEGFGIKDKPVPVPPPPFMPDQEKHLYISLVKSVIRIGAGGVMIYAGGFVAAAGGLLIAAECLGIVEELV